MTENLERPHSAPLPQPSFTLEEGEVKQISLLLSKKDGVVQVGLMTDGFDEDINDTTVALAFVLEKLTQEQGL